MPEIPRWLPACGQKRRQACLQALSEVLAMVKKYRRKQRMEATDLTFAVVCLALKASVLELVAKAMLTTTELQAPAFSTPWLRD